MHAALGRDLGPSIKPQRANQAAQCKNIESASETARACCKVPVTLRTRAATAMGIRRGNTGRSPDASWSGTSANEQQRACVRACVRACNASQNSSMPLEVRRGGYITRLYHHRRHRRRAGRWCDPFSLVDAVHSLHSLHSLHRLRQRPCSHIPLPPHSLHTLRRRPCSHIPLPPQSLHWLSMRSCSHIDPPPHSLHVLRRRPCSHNDDPLCTGCVVGRVRSGTSTASRRPAAACICRPLAAQPRTRRSPCA